MGDPLPALSIPVPGSFKAFVISPHPSEAASGEILLWSIAPPVPNPALGINFPRFRIAYTVQVGQPPVVSLLKQNEQTGFLLGAPIFLVPPPGTLVTSRGFYLDICGSELSFYNHRREVDFWGSFTDAEFANMKAVSGLGASVFGASLNPNCIAPIAPSIPVNCRSKCHGGAVEFWDAFCC